MNDPIYLYVFYKVKIQIYYYSSARFEKNYILSQVANRAQI